MVGVQTAGQIQRQRHDFDGASVHDETARPSRPVDVPSAFDLPSDWLPQTRCHLATQRQSHHLRRYENRPKETGALYDLWRRIKNTWQSRALFFSHLYDFLFACLDCRSSQLQRRRQFLHAGNRHDQIRRRRYLHRPRTQLTGMHSQMAIAI